MASAFPSGSNTFVPTFDASGQLVVGYSRNVKDFPLNQYVTLTPVKKTSGYYLRITPENAARVLKTDLSDFLWPDGDNAPTGEWNTESHEFFQFTCQRYGYPFRLGYLAVEQADWKIIAYHAAMAAQQAMTGRTLDVATVLTTQANWPAANTETATVLGGGFLNAGTADGASPGFVLKKALNAAAIVINKASLGTIKPRDLKVVITPTVADALGRSKEIHAYLKESPAALAQVRGDAPSQNGMWGLPDKLYGYDIVVEDAIRTTSVKGATLAQSYVSATFDNSAMVVARPGGLIGVEGAPSFSTIHLFMYEEMSVESRDDPDNRRNLGRVVENFDSQLVSPLSGFFIRNALS